MLQLFTKKNRKGFTLIELLVVIAIIGILATIVLVSLNTARQKARNARRESDVRQIGLALEMYTDAQANVYPPTLADIQPTYFPGGLPDDPQQPDAIITTANGYIYTPGSPASTYCLTAAFEPAGGGFYSTENGTGLSATNVDCDAD